MGHAGRAEDQASILGVRLQHLLGLMASDSEETPAAERKGKPHLCHPPGAAWLTDTGAAAGGGGFLLWLTGDSNSRWEIVWAFSPPRGLSGEGADGG